MNVCEYISNNCKSLPEHTAIIENGVEVSYFQLHEKIKAVAILLTGLGINKQSGVAVLGGNSIDFIVMAFAVMKLDAVVLPLPEHLSSEELSAFINTSELNIVLFNKKYNDYPGNAIESDHLNSNWSIWVNTQIDSDNKYACFVKHPALVRFTSGTTGKAKGVILSHQTIHDRIEAANDGLKLAHDDKVLWVLSMAFHFVVSIILYLKSGCSIILTNNFLAKDILENINKYSATFLYASPMHIRLLSNDNSGLRMPTITKVISTSTAITKEQCIHFYNKYNVPVSQAYGIIEIGLPVINLKNAIEHPEAIGLPVNGYDVSIFDDDGKKIINGEVGDLAIKGPGMFDGYLSPSLKQSEVLRSGYFYTGDLAKKRNDGLITIEGRKKSMINVGGNKVFPEEVEGVLMQLPYIKNCRISGYKHPLLGESVMAEIQLNKNNDAIDTEKIYQYCKSKLSAYKVPQKIEFVKKLTMTKSGKVKR